MSFILIVTIHNLKTQLQCYQNIGNVMIVHINLAEKASDKCVVSMKELK